MLRGMRRRLYLMRHADVSYLGESNPELVHLTDLGREHAEAARAALAGIDFDLVVTSTLPRTTETASIVAPGREQAAWPEFSEWRGGHLGDLEPTELEQLFVSALHAREETDRFLGGESLGEVLDRVLPAFERLLAQEWETALAVFHGGVNRILLSQALGGGRSFFGGFEQAPACINVLDVGDSGWIVRTVNYIPYDPLHPARTTTMEDLWAGLAQWFEGLR
jgi:broad specificity phosphatase PhoE